MDLLLYDLQILLTVTKILKEHQLQSGAVMQVVYN
jgi:hypothetical protein